MALKAVYDKLDSVPENFRELYTERDGKWELTGVEGVKTQSDVDRVSEALRKEKDDHKKTKDALKAFGDMDPVKTAEDLDELEELRVRVEANGKGGIDDDKLQKLVDQRVARERAPIERENKKLRDENVKLAETNTGLSKTITTGKIDAEIRKAAEAAKVVPTAVDDLVVIGRGIFEVTDDGAVVTRDGVGVTPGIGVDVYLTDMKERRPHWWPTSKGGGAGGNGRDGGGGGGSNPWSKDHWNMTEQGRVLREQGRDKADQLARSAGSKIGATGPTTPSA